MMKSRSWKRLRGWMDENGLASGGEVSGKRVGSELMNKERKSKDPHKARTRRAIMHERTYDVCSACTYTHARKRERMHA